MNLFIRVVLTMCLLSLVSGQALSQDSQPSDDASACLGELDGVQQAIDEEDQGRALVLLDMATESCVASRQALIDSMGEEPLTSGLAALETLWRMEIRHADLLRQMEQCDEARSALARVSGQAPLPSSLEVEFARSAHAALGCGPTPGVPTGGTVSMGPGYMDVTMTGTAVGEVSASTLGSDCWGNIPTNPSYTLEVTTDVSLSVYAYSYSGGDLVLAVTGPGGTFCNDDWDGVDPGMYQYFSAGSYEVYVGEYSMSGMGTDYSLTFSTTSLVTSYVYPTYGSAYLGVGSGRTTLSGSAWGVNDASLTVDAACAGWIGDNPDFQMTVEGTMETWVTVTGAAGTDLTLVIQGPSGTECRDDDSGSDPVFNGELPTGTYNVWVGDKAGASTGASYGIQFSSYDPMTILETEPTDGIATISASSGTSVLSGRTGATIPASDFFGTSCYGSVGTAPSHRLVVEEGGMIEVVSRATYSGDLVIAVSGPDGTHCNDDYDGLNPGIRRWLNPGEYAVYIGPLGTYATEIDFVTTFTWAQGTAPVDLSGLTEGLFGAATIGTEPDTITLSGTSGGPNLASTLDATCTGYITEEPSFILDVTAGTTVAAHVMSEGDTTIAFVGPEGTICNDDYTGLNPGIEQYLAPGHYGVWVGSYSADTASPFMVSFRSYYY